VAIIGLASKVNPKDIERAISIMESWGLNVIPGKHLFHDHYRFSGSELERAQDFQKALNDTPIKAIFAARGGYGSSKLIDQTNWQQFIKDPKWIIGFSDITAILQHVLKLGVAGIHGIMPAQFKKQEYRNSLNSLRDLLFGNKISLVSPKHPFSQPGKAKGQLVGGNLSILCSLIGTSSDITFDNKILFIEEVQEEVFRIDRLMNQLKRSGKLNNLRGVLIGHFTEIQDDPANPYGQSIEELISGYFTNQNIPVGFGLPIGHKPENYPVIVGMEYELAIDDNGVKLFF